MTWRKREIMDMAREAGIRDCTCSGEFGCLEAFAKLVREDEREECAKVCEDAISGANELMDVTREMDARAIRARGQA